MKKGYILSFGLCCLAAIMMAASDGFAARFSYYGPGNLISGSGTGRVDYKVWFAGMRHPIELWPSYANSQVYRPGGMYGGGGGECDSSNYSYPWRDNFCETRGYRTPLCPSGYGHQGQDIRPRACRDNTYWAVATETAGSPVSAPIRSTCRVIAVFATHTCTCMKTVLPSTGESMLKKAIASAGSPIILGAAAVAPTAPPSICIMN